MRAEKQAAAPDATQPMTDHASPQVTIGHPESLASRAFPVRTVDRVGAASEGVLTVRLVAVPTVFDSVEGLHPHFWALASAVLGT